LSTESSSPDLSVVVPVYCCADCLARLCERIFAASATLGSVEVLLICDASPDHSWPVIESLATADPRVRGIKLSRNFGQHPAIAAGLAHARGNWISVMDCDLQDPPEALPELFAHARQGHSVVLAQRSERQDHALKRLSSALFYRVLGFLTDTRFDASVGNFGLYHRKVIDAINAMPERSRFFPLMVRWTGFSSISVPVAHAARAEGKSSYRLMTLVRLALNIVLSYSDKPLRLVVKTGFLVSLLALLIAAYAVLKFFSGDITVAGFTSLIASIWLLGGLMLSSIGVVGLYVGRIHLDVKARPVFLIDAVTGPQ
jgi:polyisoprenyl-phosphate glycosyltransferase